jgi:hypothetical protein
MLTPRPLIYAELLSNIRQISIIAALDSPCDSTTKAELSADGHQIILHHGGIVTSLVLPGQVSQAAQLQKPVLGSKELSWRLPVAGPAQGTRAGLEDAQKNDAPWSAKSLGKDTEFSCRKCGAVVLKRRSIKIWKDLPSENWAEMMDFWHCHKPDVHEPNDSSGHGSHLEGGGPVASKGYGADTKFTATTTVGFVDITTFLLANSDCSSLQVRRYFSLIYTALYISFNLQRYCMMGIKKVATLYFCCSVAWSPIQMPKINTLLPFCSGSSYSCLPSSPDYGLLV